MSTGLFLSLLAFGLIYLICDINIELVINDKEYHFKNKKD